MLIVTSFACRYVSSAVSGIKYYVEKYGDIAKTEINKAAPAHVITMDFDDHSKVSYCGVTITPTGQLAMIFKDGNLGSNISHVTNEEQLNRALNNDVADEGLAWQTRLNIAEYFTPKVAGLNKKLSELLKKEYTFDPSFEANYAKLKEAKNGDFKENLGYITHSYYEGLIDHLSYKKFGSDDMLQEAFNEAAEEGKVVFRVVDNGKTKKSYGDAIFDGGVLYLQVCQSHVNLVRVTLLLIRHSKTTPEYYGSNTGQAAEKLEDEL